MSKGVWGGGFRATCFPSGYHGCLGPADVFAHPDLEVSPAVNSQLGCGRIPPFHPGVTSLGKIGSTPPHQNLSNTS